MSSHRSCSVSQESYCVIVIRCLPPLRHDTQEGLRCVSQEYSPLRFAGGFCDKDYMFPVVSAASRRSSLRCVSQEASLEDSPLRLAGVFLRCVSQEDSPSRHRCRMTSAAAIRRRASAAFRRSFLRCVSQEVYMFSAASVASRRSLLRCVSQEASQEDSFNRILCCVRAAAPGPIGVGSSAASRRKSSFAARPRRTILRCVSQEDCPLRYSWSPLTYRRCLRYVAP